MNQLDIPRYCSFNKDINQFCFSRLSRVSAKLSKLSTWRRAAFPCSFCSVLPCFAIAPGHHSLIMTIARCLNSKSPKSCNSASLALAKESAFAHFAHHLLHSFVLIDEQIHLPRISQGHRRPPGLRDSMPS